MRCCWVCGGIPGWRASYQGLGLAWILSGSLVDGTAFNTLFSRMLLGQGSALPRVFIVGLQIVGLLPDVQVNMVPSRSLGGLLSGH